MRFNDAELDRLGEKRRSCKEKWDAHKAEVDLTYRGIKEIKESLPHIYEQIGYAKGSPRDYFVR